MVPSENILHEAHTDDTHGPLEILSPRLDDGGLANTSKTNDGLRLEVAEERQRISSDVGGGIGVSEAGEDSRRHEGQASNDGRRPLDTNEIDGLAVRDLGLNTGGSFASLGQVDVNANLCVKIGDVVGDTRDGSLRRLGQVDSETEGNLSSNHGAETGKIKIARVDGLVEESVTIGPARDIELDMTLDGRGSDDFDAGGVVVWCVNDIEQTGSERRFLLASVQGAGPEHSLSLSRGDVARDGREGEKRCVEQPHDDDYWRRAVSARFCGEEQPSSADAI